MPNPLAEQLLHQYLLRLLRSGNKPLALYNAVFVLPKAYQQYGAVLPRMEVEMSILPNLAISPASTSCQMHVQLCNPRKNRSSK